MYMRWKWHSLLIFLLTEVVCINYVGLAAAEVLPAGDTKPAIVAEHFPDRLHTFVWRNWESVGLERMAEVLGTTPDNVRKMGRLMGLPPHVQPADEYQQRGYISIIRRNWHLLPYEQLLTLLDWNADKLAFTLREDDFLWAKLGRFKPVCPPLCYVEPDEQSKKRCAEIKAIVSSHFSDEFIKPQCRTKNGVQQSRLFGAARFDFVRVLSAVDKQKKPRTYFQIPSSQSRCGAAGKQEPIRFLYSYFAVYGDPLLNPKLDPYPEGLLQRLAEMGVNGVWLHTVLNQLAHSPVFPQFGDGHEVRLANLRKMVNRAKRYGINIYLYMNEPRAMPVSFFEGREHIKGVQEGDYCALCTSAPQVRQWITDSLTYVFKKVPRLGGVFTITASENLTNCWSHQNPRGCPRCSKRSAPEVIAEVNGAIAAGVWRGNPDARIIVWDWGWPDGTAWGKNRWAEQTINLLPDNVYLMSVSEWSKPIVRGGVASEVGEYSISAVGPGPRAQRHWSLAKQRGLKTIAKVQVNCSWELSALPYLPVMDLIAQHCDNLTKADVDGLMLSWTLGGYPSPNLQLVKQFGMQPAPTIKQALTKVATARYGKKAAPDVLDAWSKFSDAFTEYPFHTEYIYRGPTQYGPSNLLYTEPTGYQATMVGFPYDNVEGWRAVYPVEVLANQFEKLATGWKKGLPIFERALNETNTPVQHANACEDLRIAEAAYLHFKSVANQIRFTLARDALRSKSLNVNKRKNKIVDIKAIATDEIQLAKRLFTLSRKDSRIGFEASNHYYYFPLDLVEKVINCEYILNDWLTSQTQQQ